MEKQIEKTLETEIPGVPPQPAPGDGDPDVPTASNIKDQGDWTDALLGHAVRFERKAKDFVKSNPLSALSTALIAGFLFKRAFDAQDRKV